MSILLVITTDGRREFIAQTIASIEEHLAGWDRSIIWDDSGDPAYRDWLYETYTDRHLLLIAGEQRLGYQRSRARLWQFLAGLTDVTHICNWEDDMVLLAPVHLADMATILDINPHLAQVALLREDYYPREIEGSRHGRILGWHPKTYRNRTSGNLRWCEHRNYFTCNPGVHHRSLCEMGWPQADSSEKVLGDQLLAQGLRFAHWGHRDDPRILRHIGSYRAGRDY